MSNKLLIFGLIAWVGARLGETKVVPELQVKLNSGGSIRGQYMVSHKGRGIRAFKNIPYAEPPIGSLRFADPVPKAPWKDDLTLSTDSILCPQVDNVYGVGMFMGQEDCLYLNVYAPLNSKSSPLPVMFFMHGGGFMSGTGTEKLYGPDFFLDEDVILVTGNYRLAALGFLTTQTVECTGNYGMKDQVMIMRWIQQNIAAFGGDPNKVTIFGESAGGASVGYHLMSSMSKGLFHRAIMQSGTPFDNWAERTPEQSLDISLRLFDAMGCSSPTGDYKTVLECMRKKDVEEITRAITIHQQWDVNPLVSFTPSKEPAASKAAFLTAADVDNFNRSANIPLMIGLNRNEGAFAVAIMARNPKLLVELNSKFDKVMGSFLYLFENKTLEEKAGLIKDFYFNGENFNWEKHSRQLKQLIMDNNFLIGLDEMIGRRIEVNATTFAYLFNYRGVSSFLDLIWDDPDSEGRGVAHGDDLIYLFPMVKNFISSQIMNEYDQKIRKQMIKFWVSFASTGLPSADWTPVGNRHPVDYMRIGNCNADCCDPSDMLKSRMEQGLMEDNIRFQRQFMGKPVSMEIESSEED